MPELRLSLAVASLGLSPRYGKSWSERMLRLVSKHSPFVLAYLEGLVRTADARASVLETIDPILANAKLEIPIEAIKSTEVTAQTEEAESPSEEEFAAEVSDV